jgi:hypothetical protein
MSMHVIVTFHLEADDPDHPTGVTSDTFEKVSNGIAELGGEDIDFELVEDNA